MNATRRSRNVTLRVRWALNGALDSGMFSVDSLWEDVRERIRERRPDPKPAPQDIHVRALFFARWPLAGYVVP